MNPDYNAWCREVYQTDIKIIPFNLSYCFIFLCKKEPKKF